MTTMVNPGRLLHSWPPVPYRWACTRGDDLGSKLVIKADPDSPRHSPGDLFAGAIGVGVREGVSPGLDLGREPVGVFRLEGVELLRSGSTRISSPGFHCGGGSSLCTGMSLVIGVTRS